MEIFFITGKGGVGKSAVAAALAFQKSQAGKKTLLVELGEQSFYSDYFGVLNIDYKPMVLRENLSLARWSGRECLKDYAMHLIKIESLYKLFFENKMSRTLVDVAPALHELSILGKITSRERNVGPQMPFDCLIVDAFASGHFMAMLKAPEGLAKAIQFGPMGEQSRDINQILKNRNICKYFVVSTPEELPVLEALELAGQIEQQIGIPAVHIFNKTNEMDLALAEQQIQYSETGSAKNSSDLLKFQKFQSSMVLRLKRQLQFHSRLAGVGGKIFHIPWVFSQKTWEITEKMADYLKEVQ